MVKPFVKWAGGKRQLIPEILRRLPESWGTYIEPFLGGGATLFALASASRLTEAIAGDVNSDLVGTYRAIKADPDGVAAFLDEHQRLYLERDGDGRPRAEEYFYRMRGERPFAGAELAAWFLFINRAGFNGLYRVNGKGRCNTPWGQKTGRLGLPTLEELRGVAAALQHVTVDTMDFEVACDFAERGDVVYCDPPYLKPASGNGGFTSYTADGFGAADHERLALAFWRLVDRGIFVMVHNADCELARDLYDGATIDAVQGRRAINRDGAGRGGVPELIVTPPRG